MSNQTTDAERNYSSYELEVSAVIEVLKRFRVYVLGNPFKIVADCKVFAIKKTFTTRQLDRRFIA